MARYRSVYYDPEGKRYGIPTYPWQMAPAGLATRRQLAAQGLRPGGQPVAAQILWRHGRRTGTANLHRVEAAKPKRAPSQAQLAALAKALAARRRCPECGLDAGYVLSRRLGTCNPCADRGHWREQEAA